MGRLFVEFVQNDQRCSKYICRSCGCDLVSEQDMVWEGFMNINTPAFLFKRAVNLCEVVPPRREVLSTGAYTLADVGCRKCAAGLGWRYLWAEATEQKYKEGTVLLDQACLLKVTSSWAVKAQPEMRSQGTQTESGRAAVAAAAMPPVRRMEVDDFYSL